MRFLEWHLTEITGRNIALLQVGMETFDIFTTKANLKERSLTTTRQLVDPGPHQRFDELQSRRTVAERQKDGTPVETRLLDGRRLFLLTTEKIHIMLDGFFDIPSEYRDVVNLTNHCLEVPPADVPFRGYAPSSQSGESLSLASFDPPCSPSYLSRQDTA